MQYAHPECRFSYLGWWSEPVRALVLGALILGTMVLASSSFAEAQDFRPRIGGNAEFFAGHFGDRDNRRRYTFGFGVAAIFEFRPIDALGLQVGGTGSWYGRDASPSTTYYAGFLTGARLHVLELLGKRSTLGRRNHDGWLDIHYDYGVSGGVRRSGFDVGLGYEFPLGDRVDWHLGPFFRYQWADAEDGAHAGFLLFGLSIGLPGTYVRRRRSASEGSSYRSYGDEDRDGIPDGDDHCAQVAQGSYPDPRRPGCPAPQHDSDHDGIVDRDDVCPSLHRGEHEDSRRQGCPLIDTDKDGYPDDIDYCPKKPAHARSLPGEPGCPIRDQDHDTVPDATDHCPLQPGQPSSNYVENGCPGSVLLVDHEVRVNEPLLFAPGTAKLLPESREVLDETADAIQASPFIDLIKVECHSDKEARTNPELLNKRAERVVVELEKRGVPPQKLTLDDRALPETTKAPEPGPYSASHPSGFEFYVLPFTVR